MPNANWSNPTLTSTYTNFVTEVKNRDEDLALQFDGTTSTNLVTNTIRWDSSANRWKKWNGSSWAELTATYALTALSTTGNATIGGTLGVTGGATLSSTLGVTGAITGSSTVSGTALIPTAATVPTNGLYLPAANTVALATASNGRLFIDSSGNVIIGTGTGRADLTISNNTTGSIVESSIHLGYNLGAGYGYKIVNSNNPSSTSAGDFKIQRGSASSWVDAFAINNAGAISTVVTGGSTLYPALSCRAWVNFNGTGTVAIRADENVTSITDNAVGNYTVNFTTAMPDANYCVTGMCDTGSTSGSPRGISLNASGSGGVAPTTSAVKVCTGEEGTNFADFAYVYVAIFR